MRRNQDRGLPRRPGESPPPCDQPPAQPRQEVSLGADPRFIGGRLSPVPLFSLSADSLALTPSLGQHVTRMIGKRDKSHTASIDALTPVNQLVPRRYLVAEKVVQFTPWTVPCIEFPLGEGPLRPTISYPGGWLIQ